MQAPMTADERNAIRARAEAATPGPWRVGSVETWHVYVPCSTCIGPERVLLRFNEHFPHGAEAAFIAHAREDIPRLLADNDALRAENAELRWQLTHAQRNNHQRNVELDALHYVWCDGGCSTGVHRYDGKGPEAITPEIVAAAVRNTERLVTWHRGRESRAAHEARLNEPAPAHSAEEPVPGSD